MSDGKVASSRLKAAKNTNNATAVPHNELNAYASNIWLASSTATEMTNTCLSLAFFSP
jgi:hypothetical protein